MSIKDQATAQQLCDMDEPSIVRGNRCMTDADLLLSSQEDENTAVNQVGHSSALRKRRADEVVQRHAGRAIVTPDRPVQKLQKRTAAGLMLSPRTAQAPLHTKKEIKDNVHGLMVFEPVCMRIIDTIQFQRLRHLHQLGAAHHVYIGATHSRFEHCLGVAHLAEQLLLTLRRHQPWLPIDDTDIVCVKLAGLCHDLGHGPFSHVFDGIFLSRLKQYGIVPRTFEWTHEENSVAMLDHLLEANGINLRDHGLCPVRDLTFIKELILGCPLQENDGHFRGRPDSAQHFLYDIVNNAHSGLDVDKLDYFLRDAQQTGARVSSCDTYLLLHNMRVLRDRHAIDRRPALCFPEKLVGAVLQAFRTRYELHQTVYQHKAIRAIEYMICDALILANDHALVKGSRLSDVFGNMEAFQHVDDRILWRIEQSELPALQAARDLLTRVATKPYYECVGKTKVTEYSAHMSEDELKTDVLSLVDLTTDDKKHVILEVMKLHFGKKDADPIQYVRFYSKDAVNDATCYQLPREAYEVHLPKQFMEHAIRVYVRDPALKVSVRAAFDLWSCRVNKSVVMPMPGVGLAKIT